MTDNLKPLNGTFFVNVPLALELRDGKVIAAAVANPAHVEITTHNNAARAAVYAALPKIGLTR